MKTKITKEWCARMAQLEGDAEIGAGRSAFNPVFDRETPAVARSDAEWSNIAFGRFVNLMRRRHGLDLEKLAKDADVDVADLFEIENDLHHKPKIRTVHRLAEYFELPRSGFMQVAGLTVSTDRKLFDEAIRFAARSEPTSDLTPEENTALESFVTALGERV